ncbi:MAG: thioredoxin-dependent thiol peroxidase [Dehalococcoidia bacterium]
MINVGDIAPDFSLPSTGGRTVSLTDFRDKQPVLLYWYPKDDTPGCTAEACSFRDNIATLQGLGVAVLGVSPDGVAKHDKFAAKFGLPFLLLSDTDHAAAEVFGVWVEKSMYGRRYFGVERTTFLIGADGRIQRIWRKVNPNKHVAEVIAALEVAG